MSEDCPVGTLVYTHALCFSLHRRPSVSVKLSIAVGLKPRYINARGCEIERAVLMYLNISQEPERFQLKSRHVSNILVVAHKKYNPI